MRELTLFSKIQGAKPALRGPMSSDRGNTLTGALVAESYSSVQVRMGALRAVEPPETASCVLWRLAGRHGQRHDARGGGRENASARLHADTCSFER